MSILTPQKNDADRANASHRYWRSIRRTHIGNLAKATGMFLVLSLATMCIVFGSTFRQRDRIHNLTILAVDYDGSDIGQALASAYASLRSNSFPKLDFQPISAYRDPTKMKTAVCEGTYWGAIYIIPNATYRLIAALNENSSQEDYDANKALSFIYNGARYPVVAEQLLSNIKDLASSSRNAYYQTASGTSALWTMNINSTVAVSAYQNPIAYSTDVIQPTNQGARSLYTTVNFVTPVLITFFYFLSSTTEMLATGIFIKMRARNVWLLRLIAGKIFTLLESLVVSIYLFAFREHWSFYGISFFATWMTFWLYLDINLQFFEALLMSYIPHYYTAPTLITWVLLNIASVMNPLEIAPSIYVLGTAFPAHWTFALLIRTWSGCTSVNVALPVLVSWWLVGHLAAGFSVRKRCKNARETVISRK